MKEENFLTKDQQGEAESPGHHLFHDETSRFFKKCNSAKRKRKTLNGNKHGNSKPRNFKTPKFLLATTKSLVLFSFHHTHNPSLLKKTSAKMVNVSSVNKKRVVKKYTKSFERHQHQQFWRIGRSSWRKSKGKDSRVRRRFKGTIVQPKIGFGSDKTTRHLLPNGFYKFLVHNPKELELLLMHNR